MQKKKKDFDAVEWVCQVREENYRKYGHLPTREFLLALEKEGLAARAERRVSRKPATQPAPVKHHEEPDKKKDFDVMKWLRGVRDANYERLGPLPRD